MEVNGLEKSRKTWNIRRILKVIFNFIMQDPKERTEEEWEELFLVSEAIKQTRERSERRRRHRGLYSYGMAKRYKR